MAVLRGDKVVSTGSGSGFGARSETSILVANITACPFFVANVIDWNEICMIFIKSLSSSLPFPSSVFYYGVEMFIHLACSLYTRVKNAGVGW